MANTLLTPDMITRENLRILHQKLNFLGNVNHGYDDRFANEGAKIGDTLRLRRPVEYDVQSGADMATGTDLDTTEQSFTLQVNRRRHVDMRFTTDELTLSLDDFSKRHCEPAMARLAANVEADFATNVLHGVATATANTQTGIYNAVYAGTDVTLIDILNGRKNLIDSLAPPSGLVACLDTQANVDLVNALSGLFHDSAQVSKQYKEGMMGRTGGFDFYENTLLGTYTTGAAAGTNNYDVAGANQTSTDADVMSLNIDVGTAAILAGQTFTIAGVNKVHPESKTDLNIAQQFVVVGPASSTGTSTIVISPGIVASGPRQNVTAAPADNAAITFEGAASTTYNQSILFHPDAFVVGFADLIMPDDVDWKSRQVYDGISMRLLRQYQISSDQMLARCDVIYGWRTLYRGLACRVLHT